MKYIKVGLAPARAQVSRHAAGLAGRMKPPCKPWVCSTPPDGQLSALVEIDRNHCSTCFADGIQVVTGCTFGKGNIRSLGYGKFALTLIDNKTGRSVRVVATPEAMRRSQESEFIKYRKQGVPASQDR